MRSSTHSAKRRSAKGPAPESTAAQPEKHAGEPAGPRGPRAVADVVLVGPAAALAPYVPGLRTLESAGALRVQALVGEQDAGVSLAGEFRSAHQVASIDKAVVAPGALVLLATPPHLHPAQAGAAFRRGWHVLTASPLAASARDALGMITAAQRHERVLAAALPHRFSAAVNYLRILCRDQLLGPLIRIDVHDGTPATRSNESMDGALVEFGVSAIDLLTWCNGPAEIASYADDAMGGVEANAALRLSFAGGVAANVHVSREWPTSQSYEFVFERGVARWTPRLMDALQLQLASAPAALEAALSAPIAAGAPIAPAARLAAEPDSCRAQVENALDALAQRAPLAVPPTDAVSALALADACRARRTLLRQPWLSHNEAVHARTLSTPPELRRG